MNWYVLLAIVMSIAVVAAVFGLKPKGTRHVAGTHLMGMARVVLVIVVLIAGGAALFRYFGR